MALLGKKTSMPSADGALPGRSTPLEVPETHFVNGHRIVPPFPAGLCEAAFGMGCFWGAERLFWQLPGAYSTAVGYAGGFTPNPTYEEVCTGETGHAEVVRVIYDPTKVRYEDLLKLFELWERRKDQVKKFSGGMKRRLEIARGFLHTPRILFLDEPTLGLDPQSRNQLWTIVKKVNETEKVTVFLTTHYMDEADRVAHRIGVIDHGKLVAQGSPRQIKDQTGAESLEDAFLKLTGSTIRDESADPAAMMRQFAKMWSGGRR